MADSSAAYPLAPPDLAQEILDLVQQASHYKQLKKYVAQNVSMLNLYANVIQGSQRGH